MRSVLLIGVAILASISTAPARVADTRVVKVLAYYPDGDAS
jgi:hypothetical protein